jgi:hypothetical protein
VFPWLNQQFGFRFALGGSVVLTSSIFGLWAMLLKWFGIYLI